MKKRTFVSLYSGCGGMDLGFIKAGFQPVWANDIDPVAVKTYNSSKALTQNGKHRAVVGDIRQQDLPGKGAADLVIGGPPCQGFSVAGHMDPNDPRSKHVWDFLGVVRRIQPRIFVMENVKSLALNPRFEELRQSLLHEARETLGYSTQIILLNAAHYGVPQARERMFMIGIKDGDAIAPRPVSVKSPKTVRDTLKDMPSIGRTGNNYICTAKVTPAKKPVLRPSPYAGMMFNGQGRPLALGRPAVTLPASMGGNRTPIIDQLELDENEPSWVEGYHRHLMDGGRPCCSVPERLRRLTVQEAAALQTFPEDMNWQGQQSAKYRQIGNAVPPELAYHVALALKNFIP